MVDFSWRATNRISGFVAQEPNPHHKPGAAGLEKWYGRRGQLSQINVVLHWTKCSKGIINSKYWHYMHTQKATT